MKTKRNENSQKRNPKWIVASSIFQTNGLKYSENKKNISPFPEISTNFKKTLTKFPETILTSSKNYPFNEKIVLGTNTFTQTKSLAFMQYRNQIDSENEELKKRRKT